MFTLLLYIVLSDFADLDAEEAPPFEGWGWQVRIIFTLAQFIMQSLKKAGYFF